MIVDFVRNDQTGITRWKCYNILSSLLLNPDTLIELLNFIWRNFDWWRFIFRMLSTAGYILDNWWDSNLKSWHQSPRGRERESVVMSSGCITSNGVATTGTEIRQMYSPVTTAIIIILVTQAAGTRLGHHTLRTHQNIDKYIYIKYKYLYIL